METLARLDKIYGKVNGLLKHYDQARRDQSALKEENEHLQQILKETNSKIEELQNQMQVLKLAKQVSFAGDDDKIELKRKLNEFIKEIDKCVALLNS